MTVNPLVAARVESEKSPWAGIWIAEDIELIAQGVRDDSWVDGTLGVVGAGLDGLALVSDPVGALLQYGIAWLIEHVKPLSEALDWLAGDPAQIASHAQTWRNVASSLRAESDQLARAARLDLTEWQGSASEAYQRWAGQRERSLTVLAQASDTLALITEGAGMLIGTVRMMVRDAVATVVSRLIVYAGELIATAGLATALVAEQVSTLCAAWAAKIAHWLRGLISSVRNLMRESDKLAKLIELLKNKLGIGSDSGHTPDAPEPTRPPKDPRVEEARVYALGMDPATGKYRPNESATAVMLEEMLNVRLTRAPHGSRADWIDEAGRSYDAVGPFESQYFDRQWPRFSEQIELHLAKADLIPVDVSKFTPVQVAVVEDFIADRDLAPRVFIVGR